VQRGAQFLVSISNEAWFGESAARDQFLAMNVFRAVEYRRTVVRSVNGGESGFIDPYGRILTLGSTSDVGSTGYVTEAVPITAVRTFYTDYGDVFALLLVALSFGTLSMQLIARYLFQAKSPVLMEHVPSRK
jgi:apolipoprotein N-acyltransferase